MEVEFNTKRVRMDGADEWFQERKMSLHSLLNVEDVPGNSSPTVPMDINGHAMGMVAIPDEELQDGLGARSIMEAEGYLLAREAPMCDMDSTAGYSSLLVQRAICSICRGETGRCHASDPASMQSFFASSLGFEGILSYADWLCMKCYSKWYNRCKRKATSMLNLNAVASDTSPPVPTPPRRKRSTSSGKQQGTSPLAIESKDKEKETKRDTESDSALLTRIITHDNQGTAIHIQRDLEAEVDELRDELHRVRGEVIRLSQELSRRDVQMEEMLKFVKTEIAAMHVLLKEIAEAKWKTHTVHHPVVNSNVISIPANPAVHVQASAPGLVYIPPHLHNSHNHAEWHTK